METVLEILKELHPDVDFASEDGLIDRGILDSFDIVTIVAEVDARWNVMIEAKDLIPENFNSAYSLCRLVQTLLEK